MRAHPPELRCRTGLAGLALALAAAATPGFADVPAGAPEAAPPPASAPPPTSTPAAAPAPAEWPTRGRFFVAMGYDVGDTTLVQVRLSNGSTESIDANKGLVFAVGAELLPVAGARLHTRATVGVKYASIDASNGGVSYLAYPLEVVEMLALPPFRLGAGLSLSLGPRLSGSGAGAGVGAEFETSLGVVFQGEFVWRLSSPGGGSVVLGPRFIWQKLRFTDTGKAVGANAFGLYLGWAS